MKPLFTLLACNPVLFRVAVALPLYFGYIGTYWANVLRSDFWQAIFSRYDWLELFFHRQR